MLQGTRLGFPLIVRIIVPLAPLYYLTYIRTWVGCFRFMATSAVINLLHD